MVQINFALKQINAKVVYYGPGMSGKTTNLEIVHQRAPANNRGDLTSISTDGDRTLFFDYMPLDLGTIAGMKTCFQMYTVPGQVYYNSTRKLVLQGVDGVIFVADSGPDSMEANLEALRNLEENLNEYGKSLATLPHVIQFNKRDLPDAMTLERMGNELNPHGAPTFEAVAFNGQGVFPTLKGLATLVLRNIQSECAGGAPSLARTGFHAKNESTPPALTPSPAVAPTAQAGAEKHEPAGAIPAPPAVPTAAAASVPAAVGHAPAAPGARSPATPPRKPEGGSQGGTPMGSASNSGKGVSLPDLDVVSPKQKGDPLGGRPARPGGEAPGQRPGAPRAAAGPGGARPGTPPASPKPSPAGAGVGKRYTPSASTPANTPGARSGGPRQPTPPAPAPLPSPAIAPRRAAAPAAAPAPAASGGGHPLKSVGLIAAAAVIGGIAAFALLKFL